MTILIGYTDTPEGAAALRHGRLAAEAMNQPLALFPLTEHAQTEAWPGSELRAGLPATTRFLSPSAGAQRPAEDLVDLSNELGATLIVIGVRSRSRVGKMLMGSNAQSIILGATIPVLSVKADDHGQ